MPTESFAGNRFLVDLGDVILPGSLMKRLEAEIRALVLRILAELDFGGRSRLPEFVVRDLPGGTRLRAP